MKPHYLPIQPSVPIPVIRGVPFFLLALAVMALTTPRAQAQPRPYIGYVYPAGGQQGTTVQVKLGGQGLEDVDHVFVTGKGVTARVLEYNRVLNPQETTLLNEQLRELKRSKTEVASTMMSSGAGMMTSDPMMSSSSSGSSNPTYRPGTNLIARIEKRVAETVNRPASVALASITYVEVTFAPDAQPGARELRLGTPKGLSNPLVFHVGQLPENTRKAMVTTPLQVLGKEALALRKRPANEIEDRITVPCTLNGQIASGELNRYRFDARGGQNLVITTQARQLIPYIADAVPGWFQPVLVLHNAEGKEVAYDDDYRFKPDPTIFYKVPQDGEYTLEIYDAIYRGREDFVYRISVGEIPFVTSIWPIGAPAGTKPQIQALGWNLGAGASQAAATALDCSDEGVYPVSIQRDKWISNPLPFAVDTLPEASEKEPNNDTARAQKVTLPVMINGRIDRAGDEDVFQFSGKADAVVVAEVYARRLESPLDSILKLTDARGKLIAFNDDREDLVAGVNTHHADSYLMAKLPGDGTYYVHLGDTARNGGEEYAYRLRISAPQPDFALRVVPSSISLRGKGTGTLSVYCVRKDGFTGPIKLSLKDPTEGFSSSPVSLTGTQAVARLNFKTTLVSTPEPVNLTIAGKGSVEGRDVTHEAVPAEDRMQAFLWRHLVPASELKVLVYDPNYQPKPKRVPRARPPAATNNAPALVASGSSTNNQPKFSKQQVAGRLRQLKALYEEGLLTDDFYDAKVVECEAAR